MKHKPTTYFFFPEHLYPQQKKAPVVITWKPKPKPKLIDYMVLFCLGLAVYNLILYMG